MKSVTVRINEELYKDFKLYCVNNNLTIQGTINDLIGNLLENGRKTHETIIKNYEITQNSNKEVME
jgi:hypothetical protein